LLARSSWEHALSSAANTLPAIDVSNSTAAINGGSKTRRGPPLARNSGLTGDLGLMSKPFGSHVQEEFAMTPSADEGRKIAEKGAATIRNVMDKGEEVADQARRASEENYLIANEALRQFNLKFLELAHENSEANSCAWQRLPQYFL
jgi:hypothetical protein